MKLLIFMLGILSSLFVPSILYFVLEKMDYYTEDKEKSLGFTLSVTGISVSAVIILSGFMQFTLTYDYIPKKYIFGMLTGVALSICFFVIYFYFTVAGKIRMLERNMRAAEKFIKKVKDINGINTSDIVKNMVTKIQDAREILQKLYDKKSSMICRKLDGENIFTVCIPNSNGWIINDDE